jgi:hypothetical protein
VLAPRPEQLIHWFRSTCLGLPESPWERLSMEVPAIAFGPGSRCQFGHYFGGQSSVPVSSIDDIVSWLNTCTYVSDTEQFQDRDVWQEPCAFEQRRRGDCEDFALWAWRKLGEIGVDAEFIVGSVICGDDPSVRRQHAWVVYRIRREAFLFEPAAGDHRRMIRPLADARDEYVPHFSVNTHLITSAFVGCILDSHAPSTAPQD